MPKTRYLVEFQVKFKNFWKKCTMFFYDSAFYCGILTLFLLVFSGIVCWRKWRWSRGSYFWSQKSPFQQFWFENSHFYWKLTDFETKLGFWAISTRVIHFGMSDFFLEPVVRYLIEIGRILLVVWTGGKMNGADGDFVESEFWSKVELELVLFQDFHI